MAISTSLERVDSNRESGSIQLGAHRQVIQSVGASRTLLAKESGALCLFDLAAGVVFTLPTPVEGMEFHFMTTVKTTGTHKVITGTPASQFILGTIFGYTTDTTEIDGFVANGTDIVAAAHNGTTTGGDAGGRYTLTAISATQWLITGNMYCGTATPATPFATS